MKYFNLAIIAIFIFLIKSCEPSIVFTEAQPHGMKHLNAFNDLYKGSYFCESDSSTVHIKDKVVYKEREYPFALDRSAIDTMQDLILENNALYIPSQDLTLPTRIEGNKIYSQMILRDTFFSIDNDHVLTRFKGHHMLNAKTKEGKWEVAILSLEEDMNITISIAILPEDIEKLKEITPVKDLSRGDVTQYELTPSLFEFNQILKEELIFKAFDYYKRLSFPEDI